MARIRSIKPELRRDLTVGQWSRECRYAWVLLLGYLDDYGRGIDDLRLLVADLFPLDRDITERKLDAWLDLMAASALHGDPPLCRYEVDGRRFLHAPKWTRSQKVSHPLDSRCLPCPEHDGFRNDSRTVPESLPNGSGTVPERFRSSHAPADLGSKGAREQGSKGGVTPRATLTTELATMSTVDQPDTAGTLIAEWLEHVKRPPGSVIAQVGKHLATMLSEGLDPIDLRRGLIAWSAKGLNASALPSVVNEVMNAKPTRPASNRPSTTDAAVSQTLALAERLAQQERAQEGAQQVRTGPNGVTPSLGLGPPQTGGLEGRTAINAIDRRTA